MTFIVFYENGSRETVSTPYNGNSEQDVDAAWDYMYMYYPEAKYIELF